jgi:hypothetical protein
VGNDVGLAVSVGGKGVSVGIAACVSATIVNAAATAVSCTSAGFVVGTGCAPHALIIIVITSTNEEVVKRFMVLIFSYLELTIGEASPLSDDTFILYNNCPAALCDAETTKHSKILLAIYKGGSTVLSNRPAQTAVGFNCWLRYPHSPRSVTTYKERVTSPFGFVSFARFSFAVGPSQAVRALLQGSGVDPDDWDITVGVASPVDVGDVTGVSVGGSVGEGVSVGGTCVAVGTASWV